ncbi:MAG: DUF1080 domain-containing protein [Kiritimatiellaeota bacterium]|nr:DUF1080 domain-containing protein [Kiritimatiellota bacterium]
MKNTGLVLIAMATWLAGAAARADDGWISMFDGKTLNGWKSNEETPRCFSVENGVLKVSGGRAHLFYVGPDGKAQFKNFEFKAKVMTTPGANSGIYFHTQFQAKGWPAQGYECQVNTSHKDARKTGGLYAVRDVMNTAPSKDNEWFDYAIKVQDKRIVLQINGQTTADFTEPDGWQPPAGMSGRRLSAGTFGLQGHDPKSTTCYKDIQVKPLP